MDERDCIYGRAWESALNLQYAELGLGDVYGLVMWYHLRAAKRIGEKGTLFFVAVARRTGKIWRGDDSVGRMWFWMCGGYMHGAMRKHRVGDFSFCLTGSLLLLGALVKTLRSRTGREYYVTDSSPEDSKWIFFSAVLHVVINKILLLEIVRNDRRICKALLQTVWIKQISILA